MRYRLWFIVVFLAASAFTHALDREAFTTTQFHLNVMIGPDAHVLSVTGTVTLRNDASSPQKNAALQISSSFKWDGLWLDKQALEYVSESYTSDIDHTGSLSEAIVTLPAAIPPGGTATVEVQYGGTITPDSTRFTRIGVPENVALRNDWDQISEPFTAVRGLGYVVWYPVAISAASLSEGNSVEDAIARWNERHRKSQFYATLTAESSRTSPVSIALSTPGSGLGTQTPTIGGVPDQNPAALWAKNEYKLDALNGMTPAFAVAPFRSLARPGLEILHTTEHELIAKDYAVAAEANDPLLKDWVPEAGKPVRIVELTDATATPYQDGSTLFVPLLSGTQQNLQLLLLPTQVSARSPSWRPWIRGGLGLFLQAKSVQQREGRGGALQFLARYQQPMAKAEEAQPGAANQPAHRNEADNTLLNTSDEVYLRVKGGFVFWMLSDMLGDTVVQHALQTYKGSPDSDPTQLQKLLEAQSKQNLEWFFDDWVYRDRGLPDFRVESAVTRKVLNGPFDAVLVTATIENRGKAAAEVPVSVQTAHGEKSARVLVKAHDKAIVRIEVPEAPTRVTVNDGSVPEAATANNVYTFESKPQS